MAFDLRNWMRDLRQAKVDRTGKSSQLQPDYLLEEESLEEAVPYKLEPSRSEIEDYLKGIRGGGL